MNERLFSTMTEEERRRCYNVAIESREVEDTFSGFCSTMDCSIFNSVTGEPIEIA